MRTTSSEPTTFSFCAVETVLTVALFAKGPYLIMDFCAASLQRPPDEVTAPPWWPASLATLPPVAGARGSGEDAAPPRTAAPIRLAVAAVPLVGRWPLRAVVVADVNDAMEETDPTGRLISIDPWPMTKNEFDSCRCGPSSTVMELPVQARTHCQL